MSDPERHEVQDDERLAKLIGRVRPQRERVAEEPRRAGTMRPAETRGRRSFTVAWGSDGSPQMRNG